MVWLTGSAETHAQVKVADDVILLTKGQSKKEQLRTHEHLTPLGAGQSPFPNSPGAGLPTLGEGPSIRPLPGVLSAAAAPPGGNFGAGPPLRIVTPSQLPAGQVPLYGSLELPAEEDEGPPNGLTLDVAIDRLVQANYDLLTKFQEIPKADADILSAGLRLNPVLFASADTLPYGNYSAQRPGAASYEATLIQPIDLNQKRQHRICLARRARDVLEAQYQNAVRLQIDNLYTAFVDVLEAREIVRAMRTSLKGLADVVKTTRELAQKGLQPRTDIDRALIQQQSAEVALQGAEATLAQAKRNLATLLAVPPEQADCLEVRGTLRDRMAPPPCNAELIRFATAARPDLMAYRLGVERAGAAVKLAEAEAVEDVFLFYNPCTYTDYQPQGKQSATSCGVGVLIPLPIFNRNQGTIRRAKINVAQTQIELEGLEREVANEVQRAAADCAVSHAAVQRYDQEILATARNLRDQEYKLFTTGQEGLLAYLNTQRQYNEVVRQYLETLVRHRRHLLRINTAVGQRIVP